MLFNKLAIQMFLVIPKKFGDNRGYFMETFKVSIPDMQNYQVCSGQSVVFC
jgi:dTDP-4-dehydrorhamnose 3,5-epimerase-like enzyme